MHHKIGHVARVARLSVRALRHYDDIGLVRPTGRSEAGYRLYTDADLERLQTVLFFRELGFRLEDIRRLLESPGFDRRRALIEQRARLRENADRATALVRLVERTIRNLEGEETMTPEEMFEGFDPSRYEEEVEGRWGKTAPYAESARRTKGYTKDDWTALRAEADAITAAFAEAMEEGVPPGDSRATDLAERHRLHIDRWFYPCPPRMHVGLGEMYVADARFAASYEKHRPGLTAYLLEAFRANASRRDDQRA